MVAMQTSYHLGRQCSTKQVSAYGALPQAGMNRAFGPWFLRVVRATPLGVERIFDIHAFLDSIELK
jgi:hypothetical protein